MSHEKMGRRSHMATAVRVRQRSVTDRKEDAFSRRRGPVRSTTTREGAGTRGTLILVNAFKCVTLIELVFVVNRSNDLSCTESPAVPCASVKVIEYSYE